MVRRRVAYLEVAERPAGAGPQPVDLGLDATRHVPPAPRSGARRGPPWGWVVAVALVGALAVRSVDLGGVPLPQAIERAPIAPAGVRTDDAVVIGAAQVVAPSWSGVFEHHPDVRDEAPVDRVHLLALATDSALAGRAANALLVVDATRRAFGGPDSSWSDVAPDVRILGAAEGDGLRTMQWDVEGYGLSLSTVGLELGEQQRLADAVWLPAGPSLLSGRAPGLAPGVLAELGMEVRERMSGPATPTGSPLIGQAGGASIDGLLHRQGRDALLVSVVQDQLVDAEMTRRALGPATAVTVRGVTRITAAAALAHPGTAPSDRRIRGWSRLVLDHAGDVTVELSSDVFDVDELMEVAGDLDLERLARTAVPQP